MNTKNNKRKRESREKIESAFTSLLETKEITQITVSEICKMTNLNRSTFYANYADVYELADVIREKIEENFESIHNVEGENNFYVNLFNHISENQPFYRMYFKLGYENQYNITSYDTALAEKHFNNKYIPYHMEFYKSGITAVIKKWLCGGCKETPEEMAEILLEEYKGRVEYFEE